MSGSKKPLSPLAKAFVFYGSYHSDHTNQVIHVACVPVILTTALGFLAKLPLPASAGALVPAIAKRAFGAAASTWALPVAVGYAGYYLSLAPGLLGASAAALVLGGLKLSTVAQALVSNRVLVGAHVVSWLAQFVGHGVYEGRSPALLDNLFQAIFMAPFFVYMETLMWCGFLKSVKAEVDPVIKAQVAEFRVNKVRPPMPPSKWE